MPVGVEHLGVVLFYQVVIISAQTFDASRR